MNAVLGALLVTSLVAPAGAVAAPVAGPGQAPAPRASRDLHDDYRLKDNGTYVLFGRATPEGGRRPIVLERRTCGTCPFVATVRQRTDGKGRFQFALEFPVSSTATWTYRALMRGGQDYRTARTGLYDVCSRAQC